MAGVQPENNPSRRARRYWCQMSEESRVCHIKHVAVEKPVSWRKRGQRCTFEVLGVGSRECLLSGRGGNYVKGHCLFVQRCRESPARLVNPRWGWSWRPRGVTEGASEFEPLIWISDFFPLSGSREHRAPSHFRTISRGPPRCTPLSMQRSHPLEPCVLLTRTLQLSWERGKQSPDQTQLFHFTSYLLGKYLACLHQRGKKFSSNQGELIFFKRKDKNKKTTITLRHNLILLERLPPPPRGL